MKSDRVPENLLIGELSRKLYFVELEQKLLSITYSLASDKVYTLDRAIPELIEIINLMELEQQAIMIEINRIRELSD